jgi:PAS domain S-box-containing protein
MASMETLARILDSIADGVVALDRQWRVVHVNRAAEDLLRRPREELIGGDFWLAFPELLGSSFDTELHRAVAQQETVTFEAAHPTLGVTLDVRAHPSADGLSFSFRDVTARRQEEARLADALAREQAGRAEQRRANFLARLGVLLSSSLDQATTLERLAGLVVPALADLCVIDLVDDDGGVVRVASAHGEEGHRRLVEELRRFPPRMNPRNPVERVLATGQPQAATHVDEATLRDIAQDDEHLQIMRALGITSYMMVPLVARGRTLGVISFVSSRPDRRYAGPDLALAEDVARRAALAVDNARLFGDSERRRREAEVLTELNRLISETLELEVVAQRIVDAMRQLGDVKTAALYRLDADSGDLRLLAGVGPRVDGTPAFAEDAVAVSRAIQATVPVATADLLTDPAITLPPEARARIEALGIRAVLAVPLHIHGRVIGGLAVGDVAGRLFTREEVRLLERFAAKAAVAIENAQLYAEERAARSEAEQASRAKDDFLAILSHELRTPLQAMLGWARMLRTGKLDEAAARRAAEAIERNTRLQTQLIEDLLDVSRIVAGKLQLDERPVHLVPVIEAAVEAVRAEAEAKALTIETELDPSASPVWGDPARLQQVAWNLLSNAVKFTPPAGHVDIRLERADGHARLVVRDDGQGFGADLLPHIFERFRQADSSASRRFGGLGLGLAIARELVEMHHGRIEAASDGEGRGATFTVTLPIMPLPAPTSRRRRPARRRRAPQLSGLGGIRVLAVDDESDTRQLLAAVLGQAGADVRTAASASEALAVFDAWRPDVLVADLAMPDEDGLMLMRRVRARPVEAGGAVPAVALTAFARAEDQERALAAGFHAHVAKPADPAQLVSLLADLIRRPAA